jgi:tRNA modification GTPase
MPIYLARILKWKTGFVASRSCCRFISSDNEASHQIAMQQMRGGFSNEIAKLREELFLLR